MGVSTFFTVYARDRHGAHRLYDRRKASPHGRRRSGTSTSKAGPYPYPYLTRFGIAWAAAFWLALAAPVCAETLRIATYDPGLTRRGPGLLLRDLAKGDDQQIAAAIAVIAQADADIVLLTGVDYDGQQAAMAALKGALNAAGLRYAHSFGDWPNAGLRTGVDMDGDGRVNTASDTQGFGRFSGNGGMAVFSRYPLERVADFTEMLWRDLPGSEARAELMPAQVWEIQRLSSVNHWDLRVNTPGGPVHLLTLAATPPVFDGPEDRNGYRNADETRLWRLYLSGALQSPAPDAPVVIAGRVNLDPFDGDGRPQALASLLALGRVVDPAPASAGGAAAADPDHQGPPEMDTADYDSPPGNLRVDYVLPDARLLVTGAGVIWPAPDAPETSDGPSLAQVVAASRHRLVWVDVELDG